MKKVIVFANTMKKLIVFGKHYETINSVFGERPNTSLALCSEYPLVTHDPNMLKNKSRGNLVGKIKVSLPEGKSKIFARNK